MLKCAVDHEPVRQSFTKSTRQFQVSFDCNHCADYPYQEQCSPKIYKKVSPLLPRKMDLTERKVKIYAEGKQRFKRTTAFPIHDYLFPTSPLHHYLCLYPVYNVIKRHPIIAHAQNLCFFISFRLLICDYSKSCILFRLIPSVDILWNNADVVGCKIPLTPSKISPALKVTINR